MGVAASELGIDAPQMRSAVTNSKPRLFTLLEGSRVAVTAVMAVAAAAAAARELTVGEAKSVPLSAPCCDNTHLIRSFAQLMSAASLE